MIIKILGAAPVALMVSIALGSMVLDMIFGVGRYE